MSTIKPARLTGMEVKMTNLQLHIKCKENALQRLEARYDCIDPLNGRINPLAEYAIEYLEELRYLKEFTGLNCKVVGQTTFQRLLERADFYDLSLDGKFVKVARALTFPYEPVYLVTLANVIED